MVFLPSGRWGNHCHRTPLNCDQANLSATSGGDRDALTVIVAHAPQTVSDTELKEIRCLSTARNAKRAREGSLICNWPPITLWTTHLSRTNRYHLPSRPRVK
jgi:hypothetical protein